MYHTLSDKNIVSELLSWYSIKDIALKSNISEKTLVNSLLDEFTSFSDIVSHKLRTFFNSHVIKESKKITVDELRSNVLNCKNVIMNTPDGFQTVSKFYDKKIKCILHIETTNHSIKCSEDHLIETEMGWVAANEIVIGSEIITKSGLEAVININTLEDTKVFDFTIDHENHRYWGGNGISSHNSGKSYILCNIIREAQNDGAIVLAIDSENALDPKFMSRAGVNISEDVLSYVQVVTIQDVTKVISEFLTGYEKEYGKSNKTAPKILIVLDSLNNCLTDAENEKFEKGIQTGDQGQSAKNKKHLLRTLVSRLPKNNACFVFTDQVYPQDVMLGDGAWAVTNGVKYSASGIALITKLKLKEGTEISGIRMRIENYKSRFVKAGTKIEVEIPYTVGLTPIAGLIDNGKELGILEADGIVVRDGHGFLTEVVVDGVLKTIKFKRTELTNDLAKLILSTNPKAIAIEKQFDEFECSDMFLPEIEPGIVDTETGEIITVNE